MSGQSVKLQIKEPFSFQDMVQVIGHDGPWAITQFSTANDRAKKQPPWETASTGPSHATLRREYADPVTLEQFCKQTGVDKALIHSFEVQDD